MGTIASNGTGGGSSSAGASWAGGVVPIEGDKVNIVSGDTITLDSTHIWGDDTTTAINIKSGGILKASRVANCDLTCKGTLVNEAGGEFDFGKTGDAIPAGVSAILRLNYSAAITAGKYSYLTVQTSKTYINGETRTKWTRLNGALTIGATSAILDDVTGWATGDIIVFMASDGTYTHDDMRTIATIDTPNKTITFTATTYAHADNIYVGNFSHNVIIRSHSTGTGKQGGMFLYGTQTTGVIDIKNFACQYLGGNGGYGIYIGTGLAYQTTAITNFNNISFYEYYNATGALYMYSYYGEYGGTEVIHSNLIGYNTGTANAANTFIYTANNTVARFDNCICFRNQGGASISSGNGLGGYACEFNSCVLCTGNPPISGAGNDWTFNDCQLFLPQTNYYMSVSVGGEWRFNRCYFGQAPNITFTGATQSSSIDLTSTLYNIKKIYTDCYFTYSGTFNYYPQYQYLGTDVLRLIIANKNAVATAQEAYTAGGNFFRDGVTYKVGTNSIRYEGITNCGKYGFLKFDIPAPNGKPVAVTGFLRKNSSYGSVYRPYVTLTGMGIVTSTYTMTDVNDTWEQFIVNGTNNTGYDGTFTLTVYCQSSNTSGYAYINGISAPAPVAINTGEFGYWSDGQPLKLISANYIAPVDVWNVLTTDTTLAGSMGKQSNDTRTQVENAKALIIST